MKFGDASWPGPRPLITPKYATNSGKETTMTPSRDWIDINWADGSLAEVSRWIAVLPLAATEQHGPHLPLETDVLIADAYLARVREIGVCDQHVRLERQMRPVLLGRRQRQHRDPARHIRRGSIGPVDVDPVAGRRH